MPSAGKAEGVLHETRLILRCEGTDMHRREELLKKLNAQIRVSGHIVGAVAGSGMIAEYTSVGGADFLLALSAGKYRMMGRGSLASYLCFGNSNDIVMELGTKELLSLVRNVPVLFGIFASDPGIHLRDYLQEIRDAGFAGIANYPTLSVIDGKFRAALEEEGTGFSEEVEAIRLANSLGLFTVAFVSNAREAEAMARAGADVVCAHFGLTRGGMRGPKNHIPLAQLQKMAGDVFAACDSVRPDVIKMVYAGSAGTPVDMQYIYQNTSCQGYIGGSTFDRIAIEKAVVNTTRAFKSDGNFDSRNPVSQIISGSVNTENYAQFICNYVQEHYMHDIKLSDLATVLHISGSYLSRRFRKDMGCSFREYLVRYRMNRAREMMQKEKMSCKTAAREVGYSDYAQFSKIFRKYMGINPRDCGKEDI